MNTPERIVIIGLGHVGITLGLALADVGYRVFGYDILERVRSALKAKKSHITEKDLPELLEKHVGGNFHVLDRMEPAVEPTAYFITVGTPLKRDNTPDYGAIDSAAHELGSILRAGDMVLLRSTVPLGTTRELVLPILEAESGLTAGEDFYIAFAPERTVEGKAFEELHNLPQVVGGFDKKSTDMAEELFKKMTPTVVRLDTLEEAEIVKLINNNYREAVFAFANEISRISRAWGLDTKKVIQAANHGYNRSQVPFPSPGVGGYCLTKDSYILMDSARQKGVTPDVLQQVREQTATMLHDLAGDIRIFAKARSLKKPRVGILGFAFKGNPPTADTRGSTTSSLIKRFNVYGGFDIYGFDPLVVPEKIREMGAEPKQSLEDLITSSDIVVVMNNHPAFSSIEPRMFDANSTTLLWDTWGIADAAKFKNHTHVVYRTL